jgi:hypothetical protein
MSSAKSSNDKQVPDSPRPSAKMRLQDLISMIERPARAKGWEFKLIAEDQENYRYATATVSRLTTSNIFDRVTATFDITNDETVKIVHQTTSAFNYGIEDLYAAVKTEFRRLYPSAQNQTPDGKNDSKSISEAAMLERLLRRFHAVARQLRHRHSDRQTLTTSDEYDVQDLLHAILRGLFDDVRAEEFSPSYAGGSSRMDFLLKSEKIVLEVKMANANLRDKQVGEQLIVDISRYKQHPDASRLICFVYDPNGYIKNPFGLEADLSGKHKELDVKVIVVSV